MSKQEVIEYLVNKLKDFEAEIAKIDEEMEDLKAKKDKLFKAFASYRETLNNEQADEMGESSAELPNINLIPHNFKNLPIHEAAEFILRRANRPLRIRHILLEIIKLGKPMTGKNSYNILYTTLKRSPEKFTKRGALWTLTKKTSEAA